jgi:copper homeostasis protein
VISRNIILEACVDSYEQAINAAQNGADRLELCSHLELDGLTPSLELCARVIKGVEIPVMAMVRPRPGNFVYTDAEFEEMASQIDSFKKIGCYGVVFGLLTPVGKVDHLRTRQLVERARPLKITFHKAFDETIDLFDALEALKTAAVDKILTSGGAKTAVEAADTLNELIDLAGLKPSIIVAGNVTQHNISLLKTLLPRAIEFHGKRIVCNV